MNRIKSNTKVGKWMRAKRYKKESKTKNIDGKLNRGKICHWQNDVNPTVGKDSITL